MKQPLACHYAVIRYLPYPESEEFVNLGVVFICPQVGYFDFRFETKRRERVTDFFPELDVDAFSHAKTQLVQELKQARQKIQPVGKPTDTQPHLLEEEVKLCNELFRELTRPREESLRFGATGTLMSEDPSAELARLFTLHVGRNLPPLHDLQEKQMERTLQTLFRKHQTPRFAPDRLGDDDYHVVFPFVRRTGERYDEVRVVKPLHLDKQNATRLIEHGEKWLLRMQHLRKMEYRLEHFLFAVRFPTDVEREKHAQALCSELRNLGVTVLPFEDTEHILAFASA